MKQNINKNGRIYNSRILDTYVRYLQSHFPAIELRLLYLKSGISADEIADEGHWFSQEEVDRFYDTLVDLTGNPNIALDAGRYAASPESLGSLRQYVMGFLTLDRFFDIFEQMTSRLTRSASYRTRRLSAHSYEITVQPYPGTEEKPFQCANRIGFFEAIGDLFDYDPPSIEHPECMFDGGQECRYIVSWPLGHMSPAKTWQLITLVLYAVLLVVGASLPELRHSFLFWHATGISGVTLLLFFYHLKNRRLARRFRELRSKSQHHLEQINTNYNHALIINEIGKTISRSTDIEQILSDVVEIFRNRLDYKRCAIYLANSDRTRLVFRKGMSQALSHFDHVKEIAFNLDNPDSRGIFVTTFHQQRPILANDISELEDRFSARSLQLIRDLGVQAMICCPIICDGQSLGILAVDNYQSRRTLLKSDLSLLMGIASTLGVSIRNAELLATLKNQLEEIRRRDRELHLHRERLEEQVNERTRELNQALVRARDLADQAKAANREKSRFLANMSHEIRTPLYGVIGMTEILLKSSLDSDQKEKANTVFESGKMLLHIIDDILDLSKIEAGKLEFEQIPFDLREQTRATIQLFSSLAEQKGLALNFEIAAKVPDCFLGDPIRLRQILSNLISNSIKFTERGEINVEIHLLETQSERASLEFSVSDTGVGIPPEKLERIVEGFTQAEDSTARKYGGTGLGTTIARHLVELQGGKISVDSKLNAGTCFKFILTYPISDIPTPSTDVEATGTSAIAEGKRIRRLLVEDNPVNQEITRWHLEDAFNCQIDLAENGIQAVAKTLSTRYDLILMDLQMPEMDGMAATTLIRRNGYTAEDVPIVGLTANILGEDHQRCLNAGMNDVLHKPLTRDGLLTSVQKWTSNLRSGTSLPGLPLAFNSRMDAKKLLEEFKGDRHAVTRVSEIFLRDTRDKLDLMEQACGASDYQTLAGLAHAIKGSAANVMSYAASTIAHRIEVAAKSKQLTRLPEELAALEAELDFFETGLARALENNDS